MKFISDIWRWLCLRPSTSAEEPRESIPDADPAVTNNGPSSGETARVLPQSLSKSSMQESSEQTPNVIIYMPPPPIIYGPPPHRSVEEGLSAPRESSPPHRLDVPKLASNSPAPAEVVPKDAPPQTKEEYVAYAEDFVAENLENFVNVTEEAVKSIAELAAAQADILTAELGLRPEITPGLVKLALYDFVILCDDSSSMTFESAHIPALIDTLRRVAHFATILQPKGISIRFLNHNEGGGKYDDLTDAHDIARKVDRVPFNGNTRLGQVLDAKIVKPMIIDKITSGKLERPVFVVIITDGQPTDEPRSSLHTTIRACKDVLSRQSYTRASAIFLISQIGTDEQATAFLRSLETDPHIGSLVFCSTENLAEKFAAVRRGGEDSLYTAWLVELFLAALDKQTRHSLTPQP